MKRDRDIFYHNLQKTILIPALNKIAAERGALTDLAKRLEKQHDMKYAKQRLAELKSGKRLLSFFFLRILVEGGVMSIDSIKRGRKLEELTETEKDVVLRLEADMDILTLIHDAKERGIDVKQLLKISLGRS